MKLTNEQHDVLTNWVINNFVPIQTINYNISAYTIHGIFERLYDDGFYVDEFVIDCVMQECGYRSKYRDGNHYFNVSQKSRAIQIYRSSLGDPSKPRKFEWL